MEKVTQAHILRLESGRSVASLAENDTSHGSIT